MVIRTKLIAAIALSIILTVGVSTAILLRIQNNRMLKASIQETEFLGDIIERAIENSMETGNTTEVQKTLENIGKNKEILTLRILSYDGSILKSTNKSELGTKLRDHTSALTGSLKEKSRETTLLKNTAINYFKNIQNKEKCYGCHDSKETIIGVIQIKHDISRNLATMLSMKRLMVFSSIFTVLVVSVILSLLFSNLVIKPLKDLLSTMHDIETGNWKASVNVISNDEIGIIGTSFNKMISEINSLFQKNLTKERELSKIKVDLEHKNKLEEFNSQLNFKIKELETANRAVTSLSKEVKCKNTDLVKAVERLKKINDIGRILTSIIETEELVKIIIRTTADLINAEKITLHLKNENKPSLTIRYQKGLGIENLSGLTLEFSQPYEELLNHNSPFLIQKAKTFMLEDSVNNTIQVGVPLKMKGQTIGVMLIENKADGSSFSEDELELLTTLSNQAMVAMENAWLYESIKGNYFSTIQSLVNALEANDIFTKGHSERVRLLSLELGRHIGLDIKELEVLEHASILHDIGKIGIDSIILQKQGKLTATEYGLIKNHPQIGNEILGPIETFEGVRKTILQHHERYDGKGYPYGLKEEEISLKSRILSVVDTFDAMMTDRPYRNSISFSKVQEELRINAGTQFDPYVVSTFMEIIDEKGEEFLLEIGYNILTKTA